MDKPIKIVLSGSGTRYPMLAGGVAKLQEIYDITEICGTSGGAIVASAVAMGYCGNELKQLILDTNIKDNNLIDFSLLSLFFDWGFIKGDKIYRMLKKTLNNAKFKDTKIPLHIVTTNIEKQCMKVFNTQSDPDISVALAVRASMAIPGIFNPVKINGDLHLDGGVCSSYFIDIFGPGIGVIGLAFLNTGIPPQKINNGLEYITATVRAMLNSINKEHIEDAPNARTIYFNSSTDSLDLNIDRKDSERMFDQGYQQASNWLNTHSF